MMRFMPLLYRVLINCQGPVIEDSFDAIPLDRWYLLMYCD